MTEKKHIQETRIKGIDTSPGICIGMAYLVDKKGVDIIEKYPISRMGLEHEKNRFKSAVQQASRELDAIIENTPEKYREHARILETHAAMLKDKMLYDKTLNVIEKDLINSEWALKKVVSEVKSIFKNISDGFFSEKANDIVHVADHIMQNLSGTKLENITDINKRVILVATDLSPADTSQLSMEKIKGFVMDRGARTSHMSIIIRSLEIPSVFGLGNATELINNDDLIIVDGINGVVIINPGEQTLEEFEELKIRYEQRKAALIKGSGAKAETTDGLLLKVMGNIEFPGEVASVTEHGGDGIGLYRTEFQYLGRQYFPNEEELFDRYKGVVEVMGDKPVTIRTLDINGDKAVSNDPDSDEANRIFGLRGIRYCLKRPDVFQIQLRAILRATAYGNVRILFPMISDYSELVEAKKCLKLAIESLDREGAEFKRNVPIGVMIEVPSAVIMADVLAEAVDFFSIGTNDLIQYSLAVDRGNIEVAHMFNPLHPAVIRLIRYVSKIARDKGIKLFICGEMAGEPLHVPILIGLGLNELSMNPQSIPAVKRMIRMLSFTQSKEFSKKVLKLSTCADVVKFVQTTYGNVLN